MDKGDLTCPAQNAAAASGGPIRRPQLRPELMDASAASRCSLPARCMAHVWAAGRYMSHAARAWLTVCRGGEGGAGQGGGPQAQ